AMGVMVHSQLAKSMVNQLEGAPPCVVIPQVMPLRPTAGIDMRARLQLSEEIVIFGAAGQITAAKQIEQLLNAFAQLNRRYPNTHLLLIGEPIAGYPLDELLFSSGVGERVTVTGFVETIDHFMDWIGAADVMVNCRFPTMGETSASVLRSFTCGRPVIVYDHGWYSELSSEVAMKIPVNDGDELLKAMLELTTQPQKRQKMGLAARKRIARDHQPEAVAKQMAEFMLSIINV
ncbi:MAG: glycosyltransferase family 4 protein, partial [Chloroflexota bacterium]